MKCFNALLHLHSCSLKERFQIPRNNLSSNSNLNLLILFFCKRAVSMWSPQLTSGTSTSPSAATGVPEPEMEFPGKVPVQTPKPVAVQASVLKDKTPNCATAQPLTPKIHTRTPVSTRKSVCRLQSPNPVPALELDSSSRAQSPNMSISRDSTNKTESRYPVRQRKAPVKLNL